LRPTRCPANEAHGATAHIERAQQRRDEGWIVLAIAVERDHHARARVRDAGTHRRRLPAGGRMLDLAQPRTARRQVGELRFGAIGRAVVDIDDLEGRAVSECCRNFRDQRRDIAASFRTGTTTETAGGMRASRSWFRLLRYGRLADFSYPRCASFLWGEELAGNPFDALERRSRQGLDAAIGTDREPSRRAANQSRIRSAPTAPTMAPAITSLT